MDVQEIHNLQEAYLDVYASQENIEEGLRSAVKRLFGGGKKESESSKPESRGEQLRKKYNVGPEKSDTSAKRQILDRSRARSEKDEKDYGDKPFQKQVANQSKAAHDRYLKAGYSKYGADDARGSGNKARKRAASLNREEFEYIVDILIEEGYDLSSYTWDEMYDVCLDEICQLDEDAGIVSGLVGLALGAKGALHAAKKTKRIGDYPKNFVKGIVDPRTYFPKKKKTQKEETDLYDIILSHLLDEGYADTEKSALAIMTNMSEEWMESVYGLAGEMIDEKTRSAELGHPEPWRRSDLGRRREEAQKSLRTPAGREQLKKKSEARRQKQTPESQKQQRSEDENFKKVERINKRPLTQRQKKESEGVRSAGSLGS